MLRAAEAYGLEFTVSKSGEEAIAALKRGAMVVASTGGTESPFTGGGHYLTLAHADNTYLYIMDPYLKSDYSKTDQAASADADSAGGASRACRGYGSAAAVYVLYR